MQISRSLSLVLLLWTLHLMVKAAPHTVVNSSSESPSLVGTTGIQLTSQPNVSTTEPTTAPSRLTEYPIDPYQMRVLGTSTSLIFSKYGPPIDSSTLLTLIANAQYQVLQAVVAAHGAGPVSQPDCEWESRKLYVRISRPLAQTDLTWLMLADALEGLRQFFESLSGWFETEITILDDRAGPVGSGSVTFW